MTISLATAGNVSQQPDPELLRKFEAERDAARADKVRAQEKQKEADAEIRRADEEQRRIEAETNAELCRLGALPASYCP